jgi:hypothetical protein
MSLEGDCRYCVHQEECINLSVVPFEVPIDTETFFADRLRGQLIRPKAFLGRRRI